MSRYYKPNHSTILYLNSSYNCIKSSSITIAKATGGSGYTSAPSIVVIPASGDMGVNASATTAITSGAVTTVTMTNNGSGYNALPTIKTVGGGDPGIITGYTALNGGSGYIQAPTIAATGGGGSGFSALVTIGNVGISSTFTITTAGTGYAVGDKLVFTGGGGGSGAIASVSTIKSNYISSLTLTNAGTGYTSAPTLTATGGGGSGFAGTTTISGGIITAYTITNTGSNYTTTPTIVFNGGGGSGAVFTPTIISGAITGITLTSAGGGYTAVPTIAIDPASTGSGAVITCALATAAVTGITILNGGSGYTSAPTFTFTAVNGGTGASATPTVNAGTPATFTASFVRTYTYTWNIPDITINDLAKLSAINIIATGFTSTSPYTYRILGLQYDSRDSFFSDYGAPILSMAQNTNVCSYGSLGGNSFAIILTPQTIRQIQISVDDDIVNKGSGQLTAINFVIALEIEEYDPVITQVGDPFSEAASKLKPY